MQQLHLVGFTTDLEGLIFSARRGAKSGSFVVPLDENLVATIAEAHRRRNGDGDDSGPLAEIGDKQGGRDRPPRPPRPESRLSPREIQGRLRTGRTIAEVAREADVDNEWVERWAAPVMAEQQKVVARARSLVFAKPRGGSSVEPLGRSVAWSVADKGVWLAPDQFDRAWSAYQSLDSWIVRFHYRSRGRDHVAEWEVTDDDELVALDRTASQLAYLDRARRRKAPPRAQMVEATEPAPEPEVAAEVAPPEPARRARRAATTRKARSATKKRATSRGRATAKKRPAGRPAAAKRARPAKKTRSAKKAVAKKTRPAKKAVAKKTRPAKKTTAAKKATAAKKTTPRKATGRTAKTTRSRKAGATRKAARKSAAGRGPGGRRPPAEPVIPRAARARQAATDMLSTEPDVVAAPRFGTPGNPPAQRRSGAGGRRTVVKARGKKAAGATARPGGTARRSSDESAAQNETQEFAVVMAPQAAPAARRPAAPAPEPRRRRQPRLRASVRRREPGDVAFAGGADEEPAVVMVARPGEDPSRAQISAERAGDLVGDQPGGEDGVDDSQRATITADAPDAGDASDAGDAPEGGDAPGGLLGRRRRRLLRR